MRAYPWREWRWCEWKRVPGNELHTCQRLLDELAAAKRRARDRSQARWEQLAVGEPLPTRRREFGVELDEGSRARSINSVNQLATDG